MKISLSTDGPPPSVEIVASGFASIPLNEGAEDGELSAVAHIVMAAFGGTPGAFAFYDGTPSIELLTPIVEQIFAGEMSPLACLLSKLSVWHWRNSEMNSPMSVTSVILPPSLA